MRRRDFVRLGAAAGASLITRAPKPSHKILIQIGRSISSSPLRPPAAIVSAIEDALRPLNVRIRELPVTPARLRALIQEATRT
jgi:hypothetical protein